MGKLDDIRALGPTHVGRMAAGKRHATKRVATATKRVATKTVASAECNETVASSSLDDLIRLVVKRAGGIAEAVAAFQALYKEARFTREKTATERSRLHRLKRKAHKT